jgi:predicted RecB family nuclease
MNLSISKIRTYKTCPLKFFYQYIQKIRVDKKEFNPLLYFKIGQYAHKYIESKIKNKELVFNSETLTKNMKKEIEKNAEFAIDFIKKFNGYEIISEMPFSLYFNEEKVIDKIKRDANFNGYIDFIAKYGKEAFVYDWKTGKKPETIDYEQLILYGYVVMKKFNLEYITIGYVYIDEKEIIEKRYTKNELMVEFANLKSEFDNISLLIESNVFNANVGKHCEFCQFGKNGKNICEYTK